MTPRDGLPRFSARRVRRGDAGHRETCATLSESLGKPPPRSSMGPLGGRRKALTTRPPQQRRCRCGGWMPRIARGFPPTPLSIEAMGAPWTIPMGH